jgi:hypothetical protein
VASAVRKSSEPYFAKAKPKKNGGYLEFIHRLPCVITGVFGVEAAHISFANREFCHFGRGKGRKAADRWVLPLGSEQHALQHSLGERPFWDSKGINPHALAVAIYGLWTELGDEAEQHCIERILNGRPRR